MERPIPIFSAGVHVCPRGDQPLRGPTATPCGCQMERGLPTPLEKGKGRWGDDTKKREREKRSKTPIATRKPKSRLFGHQGRDGGGWRHDEEEDEEEESII